MHSKFYPAAFQNMVCHKENLYASFSLTKRLILAPWLWFHGNLRHCNCSLPQSHSSSALKLALHWSLLWAMSVAQPAENIHFFWLGCGLFFFFFFLSVYWNDNIKSWIRQDCALGMRRKARTKPSCSQGSLGWWGTAACVFYISSIWNNFLGPFFVVWCCEVSPSSIKYTG